MHSLLEYFMLAGSVVEIPNNVSPFLSASLFVQLPGISWALYCTLFLALLVFSIQGTSSCILLVNILAPLKVWFKIKEKKLY
jgi:hypothetical protein